MNGLKLLFKQEKLKPMTKKMTKAEALKEFRQIYNSFCGGEAPRYRRGDVIAKRTHWNDYTDGLCKDGLITLKQYENWGQPF